MRRTTLYLLALLLAFPLLAQRKDKKNNDNSLDPIERKVKTAKAFEGFYNFYWDNKKGAIFLEIDRLKEEFLYVGSLPAGVGSNDIGLDRGQLGPQRVVQFERHGDKILMVENNYDYRAITDNTAEQKAVEDAFAKSVIWGFEIVAEAKGKFLVDASKFLLQDVHGVASRLARANQGSYSLDASKSAVYMPMTKNFPNNCEFEVTLTFSGKPKGGYIRSVTPTASLVTVRQRHSFIKLPDSNYTPRKYDPRSGYIPTSYYDYATPIYSPIKRQFILRHRLEKQDPTAKVSEAIDPIVYYLDPGTPEPIRSALLEGASWWNQAYEAIGYKDAFQVKLLPEDADPMDARYNVINWVHRSTRGWSYGSSIRDPRTGEIIKGHVSLGSLRVRQDYLIASGLIASFKNGNMESKEAMEMALARLRQLSAHEVGHTIGLLHNFAASTNDRASVMDYPHPLIKMRGNGSIDLSNAYATGIGEWDKIAIAYGYQDYPDNVDEEKALATIIEDYIKDGYRYISDSDARAKGGAHPSAHLWDNGKSAVDELTRIMRIREFVLANFDESKIQEGMPMATIEEILVPMFMLHRYQVEAAVKTIGGLNYSYAIKGDDQIVTEMIPAQTQLDALEELLATISPSALTLPEELIKKIPPRPVGFSRSRETFANRTGVTFDPLTAAENAAQLTLGLLFNAQRANRLVELPARNAEQPSLSKVIDLTLDQTLKALPIPEGLAGETSRMVGKLSIKNIMALVMNKNASEQAKAVAMLKLSETAEWLDEKLPKERNENQKAHFMYLKSQIKTFLDNPEDIDIPETLNPPAGSPIGSDLQCGN
ncbi:zinc-dependent metalloprotease [Flammeovirgaceae bacterium SG7u.111]|nr:zinc-dependent metalloprotease [Flammeovirgaceae bacterium SG7u.132]WPO38748.1 zinc-dependent metalloprotease [Flammeovirgaceae bacterium SG7u.111]